MLIDITKALKSLNEEATIVKIKLPEQVSEDTRERIKQVVTHFKAESMKGTGNYVLCSCINYIHLPELVDDRKVMMINDTGFLVFRNIYAVSIDRCFGFGVLATDTGRDVASYLAENNGYRRMKAPKEKG